MPHKNEFIEKIGVYAGGEIPSILEELEEGKFECQFHSGLSSLHCWILSAHPKLVLLESDLLSNADPQELKNLQETLTRWGILSLILVRSVEEIKQWRNRGWPQGGWPRLHFYCGPITERSLKKKITRMLTERLLFERPGVAVLSDRPYLLSHLEMIFRYYGIRMIPAGAGDFDEARRILAPEHVDALLIDVSACDEKREAFLEKFPIPHFLVSEGGDLRKEGVYFPDRFNELCLKILERAQEKKELRLTVFRDRRTGLYLPEAFLDLSEREMALAGRQGGEFSILKIQFHDMRVIEGKFGPIFAKELEIVLGLFVEHRVRSSDFTAKGFHPGQVLILFPGLNRQTVNLVGERLRASFVKAASFENGSCGGFKPRLEYELYSYPHDVEHVGELEKMLKSSFKDSKPAHLPVSAGLAEES